MGVSFREENYMRHELPTASVGITTDTRETVSSPSPQSAKALADNVGSSHFSWTNPVQEYWLDACQRWILTLDVMRQRGNNYLKQREPISPAVLNFAFEVLLDGQTFERPVNYVLVRIKPPVGGYDRITQTSIHCFRSARRSGPGDRWDEA